MSSSTTLPLATPWRDKLNGVLFVALMTVAVMQLSDLPVIRQLGFSPLVVGIVCGMLYGNFLRGTMPADWLRASTYPSADGWVYAVTDEPAIFFSLSPTGEISEMGSARGYTTSLALDPDGSRFFYVPDAHGGAWTTGAPLVSVDTATGEESVLAELNPLVESTLGVRLGGTYDITVSSSGDTLFIGMNVGALGSEDGFGDVALLIVDLE